MKKKHTAPAPCAFSIKWDTFTQTSSVPLEGEGYILYNLSVGNHNIVIARILNGY